MVNHPLSPRRDALAHIDALLGALKLALAGTALDGMAPQGHLSNPAAAATFGAGSTAVPVDLGTGLWAVLRVSADGTGRVLCVHNAADRPRAFTPTPHLPDRGDALAPLVFLHGETTTSAGTDGLECQLQPHGFVWLGRFTSHPDGGTKR